MEDGISFENLFKVRVVSSKTVVRTGRLGEKETHRITFVSEGWLNTNENVSEFLSVHKQVLTVRIQVSGSRTPVLFKIGSIRGQFIVLIRSHAVSNVEVGGRNLGFRIVHDSGHDGFLFKRSITDIVTLRLELLEDGLDGIKDIQVSGSTDITLIRRKGEDCDGNLLVCLGLGAQVGPLHGTVRKKVDAVGKRDTASSSTFTSSVNDGFDGTVNFGQRHLQSNLDRMETKFR
mmetsp:Transcript_11276/g.23077  ORF Transcript_11276/g.23077 Transcript_11276/m.23077 type:complete len:232 (-) Transcript_11276:1381-2076(-)